jgi:hypothetical protein
MKIHKKSLDLIKESFAAQNIKVHIDVGSLLSGKGEYSPDDYNLCGGEEVKTTEKFALGSYGNIEDDCPAGSDCSILKDIKSKCFDSSRSKVFHYAVVAKKSTREGVAGLGETPIEAENILGGRNFYVSLGGGDYNAAPYTDNFRRGFMAFTIMHELGHNLSLRHGGADDNNYKPNYESIMNYAYSDGLKVTGTGEQWRNFLSNYGPDYCDSDNVNLTIDVLNTEYVLDYSHGKNKDINESSIDENEGYAPETTPVDFNCDGDSTDTLTDYDLNPQVDVSKYDDKTDAEKITTITDHDDWANIKYDGLDALNSSGTTSAAAISVRATVCYHGKYAQELLRTNGFIPERRLKLGN